MDLEVVVRVLLQGCFFPLRDFVTEDLSLERLDEDELRVLNDLGDHETHEDDEEKHRDVQPDPRKCEIVDEVLHAQGNDQRR